MKDKQVYLKIIADNKEFTPQEFEDYCNKKLNPEPAKPALFDEAKEALEKRIDWIWSQTLESEYNKCHNKNLAYKVKIVKQILGSLYLTLKREVVQKVVNEKYPKIDSSLFGNPKYYFIRECSPEDTESGLQVDNSYDAFHLGETKLNNKQAAATFLALMRTPFFEGDLTI
jgi:hypothetical protein